MIRFKTTANVPENRQVLVTLPSDVSPGQVELVVEVRNEPSDPTLRRDSRPDRPSDPKLAREFDVFVQLLPELLKTCRGQFVAVHNCQVVGHGPDIAQVLKEARQQFGYIPILVQRVSEKPDVVRIVSVHRHQQPEP